MARILAKIGDCLQIPLPDGRFAYAQYVFYHNDYASLLRVFDTISNQELSVDALFNAKLLFPPVFAGFNVAIRQKHWSVIGRLPVVDFEFARFRCTQLLTHGLSPGTYHDWLLWDGTDYTRIGSLSPQHRELEYLVSWPWNHLEERIATGRNFPCGSMF